MDVSPSYFITQCLIHVNNLPCKMKEWLLISQIYRLTGRSHMLAEQHENQRMDEDCECCVIYQFGSNKRTGRFCHSNPLGCALSVNTVKHVLLFVSKQLCHKERYFKKKINRWWECVILSVNTHLFEMAEYLSNCSYHHPQS